MLPTSAKAEELRRQPPKPEAAAPETPPPLDPIKSIEHKLLEGKIIEALRQVYDPEIPVSIYDLGLIYGIDIADDKSVKIRMTLTAPACPVAGSLPGEVERKVQQIPEVKDVEVELVWEPQWDKSMMSEAAQLQLGFL
ncbi:MAG TPA: SUF system Fe-S cluster assembly protein [Tepidisphaeraceae bacterium]|nr:SUF system Fe-S cluster assembly protein [Tepidisphaeraceae bacterium]